MTVPSVEELDSFKYSDLQSLAKSLGLRANLKVRVWWSRRVAGVLGVAALGRRGGRGPELVPETVDLVKVDLGPSNSAKVGLKGSYSIHLILKLTFLGAHIGLGFKRFV